MKIPKFIRKIAAALQSSPEKFAKGLRKVIAILSPRTLPSKTTVVVKGVFGLVMIQTANAIKYFSQPTRNEMLQPSFLNDHSNCFPSISYDSYLENLGQILIVDSIADTFKIFAMIREQKARLNLKKQELATVEHELKILEETAKALPSDSVGAHKRIKATNQSLDRLKERQTTLNNYLQDPENFKNIPDDYQAIINKYFGSQFYSEILMFFICGRTLAFQIPCLDENVDQIMTENHINFFTYQFLSRNDLLFLFSFAALVVDGCYQTRMMAQPSNKSFGNAPITGGISAFALLYGIAFRGEGYERYPIEADLFSSFDEGLFKRLAGYQKMRAAIYNKEYNRVYNILSYSNDNLDDWGNKLGLKKQDVFLERGKNCLGVRLIEKNLFSLLEPIAHFYGTFKLYKNILNLLENILELRLSANAGYTAHVHKTNTHRAQVRLFQARNNVRRTNKPQHFVKTKATNGESGVEQEPSRPLLRKPGVSDAPYHSLITFSNSSNTRKIKTKKKKKEISATENSASNITALNTATAAANSPTLLFSKNDSKGDSKSRTEHQYIDEMSDEDKAKMLEKKMDILLCYRACKQKYRNLLRAILDNTAENIPLQEVLNLALKLKLSVNKTTLGGYIQIYKQYITSTHRSHDTIADPGFLSSLAANFNAIDLSTDDLNAIDETINLDCSPHGFISSLNYVLTTRPSTRS